MYDVPAGIALLILSVITIAGGLIANVRHEKAQAMRRHPSARTTPVAPVPDDESDRYRRYHSSNQHGR